MPTNAPPGLYAYHGHVHTQAENALLGGASGAIVVQGIENVQPAVAGLPERILMIRCVAFCIVGAFWFQSMSRIQYTPHTPWPEPSTFQFWGGHETELHTIF